MKKYEDMTRKELLRIAKIYGIKGRSRMNKNVLIREIEKKKIPVEEMRKFEKELKKKKSFENKTGDFVQVLPKEPGTVFVYWEVKNPGNKEIFLEIKEDKREIIKIPIMSDKGSGYMKVEEGKKVKAVIGFEENGRFIGIAESVEVLVPVSKASNDKTVRWIDTRNKANTRVKKAETKEKAALEEKRIKTEKEAKSVKYIRVRKER